jgi:hypothetical protein
VTGFFKLDGRIPPVSIFDGEPTHSLSSKDAEDLGSTDRTWQSP